MRIKVTVHQPVAESIVVKVAALAAGAVTLNSVYAFFHPSHFVIDGGVIKIHPNILNGLSTPVETFDNTFDITFQ